jgi:hypothetical protein
MAASVALEAGKPATKAFQILERGRSVITELTIQWKSDLTPGLTLGGEADSLLERHNEIKSRLTNFGSPTLSVTTDKVSPSVWVSSRLQLVKEMDDLESELFAIAKLQTPDSV